MDNFRVERPETNYLKDHLLFAFDETRDRKWIKLGDQEYLRHELPDYVYDTIFNAGARSSHIPIFKFEF